MRNGRLLLPLLLLAVSCSSVPADEVSDIKEADAAMVAQCEFLGDVESIATWELKPTHGLARVKNGVKMNAKKLGATHVVLNPPTTKPLVQTGKAYRCPGTTAGQ